MLTENEKSICCCLFNLTHNVCMVFGILGNIKAESNCRSNNLQNSYEKKLGYTDETYTKAIDNDEYTRDDFIYDHAGYGLCQWTYWSRKRGLYDYWKSQQEIVPSLSISDEWTQLNYLFSELSEKLKNKLENSETVEEAARIFMLEFEKPADQSEENIERRCEIARNLYTDWLNEKHDRENGIDVSASNDRASISEDDRWIYKDIYESKKGYSYLQIVNSLESMKVYLDIMINAVKSLAEENSHD